MDDDPPRMTLDEMQAALDHGLDDIREGRVVPLQDVLDELDRVIAEMEQSPHPAEADPAA